MIHLGEIGTKDFSLTLPEIVAKLRALASLCRYHDDDEMTTDLMEGLGALLWEIGEDLGKINEDLYGCEAEE